MGRRQAVLLESLHRHHNSRDGGASTLDSRTRLRGFVCGAGGMLDPDIAANAPKAFNRILLCELDRKNAKACETRLKTSPAKDRFKVFVGDCNQQVSEIVKEIPRGSLTLAFLDPTGLHAKIDTIKKLASAGRVDLLILFPDAVDVLRNVETYLPRLNSNLDEVLGADSNWREEWLAAGGNDASKSRQLFASIYKRQLAKHAKYVVFGEEVIKGPQGPLYRLLFASKHEKGLEFWDKVTKKELMYLYPNSPVSGWPSERRMGRPVWSWTSREGLMPNRQRRVAARSPGVTPSRSG